MGENIGSTESHETRKNLFDYAMQGKWDEAMKLYKQSPWLQLEKITEGGDTALHIAVWNRKERVAEEMVKLVSIHEDYAGVLKLQNEQGNTPLHLAASIGNVSMCECFARKCKDLVGICNKDGENPLFLAARHGQIKAFLCLLNKASESDLASYMDRRNTKGETILHCAIAGGHFELAFLIIERYKDLGSRYDENGVSPLHLLADQPNAFESGTRLSLIDKIIYHCIFVSPSCSEDAARSIDRAERHWNNNKGLFFLIVTFIKICINPSGGAKAENAGTDLDEETPAQVISEQGPASTPDQGPHERNNEYEKKVGLSQRPDDLRNFPVNYDTCFNFIMLLIKAIRGILIGQSYINKIQQKKQKHVWSAKILEKLLDKGKDGYDSTGKNPVCKDRAILYGRENLGEARGSDWLLKQMHPPGQKTSKEDLLEDPWWNWSRDQHSREGQLSTNLMHKLLEEAQTSNGLIQKLLEQAQTNRLPTVNEDRNQKWHRSLEEDYVPIRTETPILVAAKNGITEMVEKILELYPGSILDVDFRGKNAVLLAVEHRQTQLYEKLVSRKLLDERAFRVVDDKGNSALHLAATLSDYQPYQFAALQMQWEIKWYKYVKSSVPQYLFSGRNNANKTPKDVFRESHKDLVEKGGQWLSSTSNSCSLVATLITTVAFATTASVPGGMKENSSRPNLEQHPGFIVFAVSSLIALSFSVTSVITFLVILTSRYHQKDFKRDLPRKLLLGLTSLFISLGAMLVCFCAAHFFLLKDKLKLAAFPLYAVACVPVIFFAIMQFPFYFDLILATFKKVPPRTPSG